MMDFQWKLTRHGSFTAMIPFSSFLGFKSKVIVTLIGVSNINSSTLTWTIYNKPGTKILDEIPLIPLDHKDNSAYYAKFSPPTEGFIPAIRGYSSRGYRFQRLSRDTVRPQTLLMTILLATSFRTGSKENLDGLAFIDVFNLGIMEKFVFRINTNLGEAILNPEDIEQVFSKWTVARVRYYIPLTSLKHWKNNFLYIWITARGKQSGRVVTSTKRVRIL